MFEFTFEIEVAGHPVGDMEIGVDATLTSENECDLSGIFLFIGAESDALGQTSKRYVRSTDRIVVKSRRNQIITEYWREITSDDPFYSEIMAQVEAQRDEILKALHVERRAA